MAIVLCGVMGLLRSISTSYPMFLAFEFLEPALGSGIYPAAFILGMSGGSDLLSKIDLNSEYFI